MSMWQHFSDRYLGQGAAGSVERRVELVAIGLSLTLLLQLLYSGVRLAMLAEPDPVSPSLAGIEDMQPVAVERVTAAQRDEVGARPLFSITRRPPSVSATDDSKAARRSQLKNVELLGVFGSGGTAGVIALVEDKRQRILLGEELQGWTLDAVHPDRVEFVRQGRRATLPLRHRQIKGKAAPTASRQARDTDNRRGQASDARSARRANNENRARTPARLGFGRNQR